MNEEVLIREIIYNSDDYINELKIRDEVLRKPLGMSLYDEHLEVDKNDFHVGAFLDGSLVGVLILTRLNNSDLKMRQVAVSEKMQSNKIGTAIVRFAEEYAKANGFKNMVLNA